MASTDSLHELVHSLDRNEKRYYRMYCSRHAIGGENEYAVLFDLILGQTEYDEESLRQQMLQMGSRQGLVKGKHYLKRTILKAMASYHAENSSDNRLYELLQQAIFLYRKGMNAESLRLLRKAETLAQELEKHPVRLEVCRWIRNVQLRQSDFDGVVRTIEQQQRCVAEMMGDGEVMMAAFTMYAEIARLGTELPEDVIGRLEALWSDPRLTDIDSMGTFYSRYYALSVRSMYCRATGDSRGRLACLTEIVSQIERHGLILKEWPEGHVKALGNLANAQLDCLEMESHTETLGRMSALMQERHIRSDKGLNAHLATDLFNHELLHHLLLGDCEKAAEMVDTHGAMCAEISRDALPSLRMLMHYDVAYTLFLNGRHRAALRWLAGVYTEGRPDLRTDMHRLAELLRLLLHFELGNMEGFVSSQSSLKRQTMRTGQFLPLERYGLKLVKVLNDDVKGTAITNRQRLLLSKLEAMDSDAAEGVLLQDLDLRSWFESKVTGSDLRTVYRRNAQTRLDRSADRTLR